MVPRADQGSGRHRLNTVWLVRSTPAVGSSRISRSGSTGQRPGDQYPLLLAAGQLGDGVAAAARQSDRVEGVAIAVRSAAVNGTEPPAPGQPAGADHFLHGRRYAAGGGDPLRHVADPLPLAEPGTGVPNSRTSPRAAGSSPTIVRISVDLPDPLAPSTATTSPVRTARSTPRSTSRPPRSTDRSRTSTAVGLRRIGRGHVQLFAFFSSFRFVRISER